MKLQLQQALATVLNIQVAQIPNHHNDTTSDHFVSLDHPLVSLGEVSKTTLAQAVCKAVNLFNLEKECSYAIFPIGSNREDYYMAIERELLRQEATDEFKGKKMWEQFSVNDPREIITLIMSQMRECATAITHPTSFQLALLRTGCLVIAALQWTSNWITRLRMRDAALKAQNSERKGLQVVDSEPGIQ